MAALEARLSSLDAENASLRLHVHEAHATIDGLLDESVGDAASVKAASVCGADDAIEDFDNADIDTSDIPSDAVSRVIALMPDGSITLSEKQLTLSSDDLKSMRTTAKITVLRAWLIGFPARVGQKHPLLQLCITVESADWMLMLHAGAMSFSGADVRFANRMLSRNINNALDSASAAVRSIRRHMESNTSLFSDGRALFAYLWSRVENKSGVSVRLTVRAFETKSYFTLNMDSDEVEEAIEQIAADLQELPLEFSARAHAVYYYAITKLPDAIASDREEFLSDFYDGQEKERLPWRNQQILARCIAVRLEAAGGGPQAASATHEYGRGGGRGRGRGGRGRGRGEPGSGSCRVCGSDKHGSKQCNKTPCMMGCPCARDPKKCAVKRAEAPTPASTKDALGKELPTWMFEKLVAAHKAHHASGGRKGTNKASVNTATTSQTTSTSTDARDEEEPEDDEDSDAECFTSCLIGMTDEPEEIEVFSTDMTDGEVEMQYDNGANVHILASAAIAAQHGTTILGCAPFTIGGIDGSSRLPAHGYVAVCLTPPGPRAMPVEAAFALCPRAKRHILAGIPLEARYGIVQLPEPADCLLDTRTGARYALRRRNEQFFVNWRFLQAPTTPLPRNITTKQREFVRFVKIRYLEGIAQSGTLLRAPSATERVHLDVASATVPDAKDTAVTETDRKLSELVARSETRTEAVTAKLSRSPPTHEIALELPVQPEAAHSPVVAHAATDLEAARAALPHARLDGLLWASRMGMSADGFEAFRKLLEARTGLKLAKLNKAARDGLDLCKFRIAARAKRRPVKSHAEPRRKLEIGELWEIDHQPCDLQSPTDGSHGQLIAVCDVTDFGYAKNVKSHKIEDMVHFALELKVLCAKHGHTLRVLRFDRAPELASPKLKEALARHDIAVEVAPRGRHQGVRRVEGKQDPIDRLADAQLKRARMSRAYRSEARMDALDRLNMRAVNSKHGTRELSRFEHFTGTPLTHLLEHRPYAFGCAVNMLEDEQARGPSRGKGHQGRSSEGILLRTNFGSGYRVLKSNGEIVYPPDVTPLNEAELIMRGWPAGAGGVDAACGTPSDGIPKLSPIQPARAPRQPTAIKASVVVDGLDVGDRVRVWWKPDAAALRSGAPNEDKPYEGVVTKVADLPNGTREHTVVYDGYTDPKVAVRVHNFAEGRRFQRIVPASAGDVAGGVQTMPPAKVAPKAARTAKQPAAPPKTPPVTRARARAALMSQALDDALDASAEPLSVFSTVAYQLVGDLADRIECNTLEQLDDARREFYRRELTMLAKGRFAAHQRASSMLVESLEAMKAEKREVHIKTPVGERIIVVPSSTRGIDKSLERDEWLIGLQQAVDAILAQRGNGLVRISIARETGQAIAESVVVFKVKTEKDTGALDRTSPFKVRLCYDANRAKLHAVLQEKAEARAGLREPYASAVADDTLVKCLLAVAASGRRLTKADVKDAYAKANRRGPPAYMRMPQHVRQYAPDGEELVFELGSPLWGETGAGRDWQDTLHADLLKIGWKSAENVPCLYTFASPVGDCHLATIVDDLLFSETSSSQRSITRRTLELLRAQYGAITSEEDPTSFAGYKIEQNLANKSLTISMPATIEAMVDEHFPSFKQGKPDGLLSGKALRDAADALRLVPLDQRAAKLTQTQRAARSATGSLRWIEKVKPRLSVGVHRLSCVMAHPPADALRVAEGIAWWAYQSRDEGITYGGHGDGGDLGKVKGALSCGLSLAAGAPAHLLVAADASWGAPIDVIGIIITLNHAAVYHCCRKLGLTSLDSSHENECVATGKGAEANAYIREITRALGILLDGPTPIYTDNLANLMVAMNTGAARGSKHFLRRYRNVQRRIEEGEAAVLKVDDANQPADFLTKWIGKAKLDASAEFAENSRARLPSASCASATDGWTVATKRGRRVRIVG